MWVVQILDFVLLNVLIAIDYLDKVFFSSHTCFRMASGRPAAVRILHVSMQINVSFKAAASVLWSNSFVRPSHHPTPIPDKECFVLDFYLVDLTSRQLFSFPSVTKPSCLSSLKQVWLRRSRMGKGRCTSVGCQVTGPKIKPKVDEE